MKLERVLYVGYGTISAERANAMCLNIFSQQLDKFFKFAVCWTLLVLHQNDAKSWSYPTEKQQRCSACSARRFCTDTPTSMKKATSLLQSKALGPGSWWSPTSSSQVAFASLRCQLAGQRLDLRSLFATLQPGSRSGPKENRTWPFWRTR